MLSFPWQQPLTVVIPVRIIWMLGRGGQNRVRYPTYSTYSLRPSKYNAIQANAEIKVTFIRLWARKRDSNHSQDRGSRYNLLKNVATQVAAAETSSGS